MSITTVDSNVIHYEVLGRGRPLIFVHGWLGSWRYWWPSMQELSRNHRVFAFDLWGFGNSSKDPRFYSFDAYVTMVDQLLEKLGIVQPITLVGHALGAAVALRFAQQSPEKVDRLAAVALPIMGDQINARLTSGDSASFIGRVLGKGNSFPEVDAELNKADPVAMNVLASQLIQTNFVDALNDCRCPRLLIYGTQDPVVRPPNGDLDLARPEANQFCVRLEDSSHFPMLQQTAKFNRLLLDFIHSDDQVTEIKPKELWKRRTR